MKKRMGIILLAAVLFAGLFAASADAASKKAFYYGNLYPYETDGVVPKASFITDVIQDGQKVRIKGTFYKYKSLSAFSSGKKGSKKTNKTFTLTKDCKYYVTNGKGTEKVYKGRFFTELNGFWGAGCSLSFKTTKTGKVNYMAVSF